MPAYRRSRCRHVDRNHLYSCAHPGILYGERDRSINQFSCSYIVRPFPDKRKKIEVELEKILGRGREGTKAHRQGCPLWVKCLRKPDVSVFRQVTFFDGSKAQDLHPRTTAMKARIDRREGRLRYSLRLGIVEPVFGNLHNHDLRRFTLRNRRKVDAQWKLLALVHNLQKLQGKAP